MPKQTETLDDTLLRRRSPAAVQASTQKRGKEARAAGVKWGWETPVRKKDGSSRDRDRPVEDAQEKAARARLAALVVPRPLPGQTMPSDVSETTFGENDPRACPREVEEFRLAVALELDRLRANKKNYDL
jgi:hypothetical protein